MEYFIVLFGIRYDKHWRVATKAHHVQVAPPVQIQSTLSLSPNTVETPVGHYTMHILTGETFIAITDALSFADELQSCSAARKWPGKHRTQGDGNEQGATAGGRFIQGQLDREPVGQFPNHPTRDFRYDQKAVRFSLQNEFSKNSTSDP